MKPQSAAVLKLLRMYGDIGVTQQDAIRELACYRLAARISDLRADGYVITSLRVTQPRRGGATYARYVLVEKPVQLTLTDVQ